MRRKTSLSPAWTGRFMCSQTDGRSAIASMISSDMYFGCDVRNRRRVEPGNRVDRSQQIGKTRVVRKIVSIGVDRLTEKRHLPHAACNHPLDLGHDLGHRPTALFAAAIRDDAVGAEEVAAIDDGNERGRGRRRHVGIGVVVRQFGEVVAQLGNFWGNLLELREIGRVEKEVDVGKPLAQLARCWLVTMHPVNTTETSGRSRLRRSSELSLPATLSSAAWRTTHELRMTISAACSSEVAVYPASCSVAAILALSASFIWQPIVQMWKCLPLRGNGAGEAAGLSGIIGRCSI